MNRAERFIAISHTITLYGLLFLIIFTPFAIVSTLPFSYAMPWPLAVTVLTVIILVGVWLFRDIYQGTLTVLKTPLNLPAMIFLAFVIFQLIPLPPFVLHYLSPSSATIYRLVEHDVSRDISETLLTNNTALAPDSSSGQAQEKTPFSFLTRKNAASINGTAEENQTPGLHHLNQEVYGHQKERKNTGWHPITVNTYATRLEGIRLLVYLGIFFLIVNTIQTRRQIRTVVISIVFTAVSVAFLGLIQYLSGTEKVFWCYDIQRTSFFATFSNRDHFACYMGMTVPLAIGLFFTEFIRNHSRRRRFSFRDTHSGSAGHWVILYLFSITIMLASLFLAQSGAAAAAISVSFCILTGMLFYRKELRNIIWLVVPVFIITFSLLLWVGIQPVAEELSTMNIQDASFTIRLAFWKDTVRAIKDFPFFGAGLGVFPYLYPQYSFSNPLGSGYFVNHAHNDYLELALDTGIIGCCVALWALYRFLKDTALHHVLGITRGIGHTDAGNHKTKTGHPHTKENDPFILGMALGGSIGIMNIAFHSIADFNLHIQANAFLLSVLFGITTAVVHIKDFESQEPFKKGKARKILR
ncbi:MAG: O-antigen ligase family protein [Candidatus Brocadiaceae bacterium]|nr:O-antigen ligase family protein [Candidatus Brocadiaceae bacterium]